MNKPTRPESTPTSIFRSEHLPGFQCGTSAKKATSSSLSPVRFTLRQLMQLYNYRFPEPAKDLPPGWQYQQGYDVTFAGQVEPTRWYHKSAEPPLLVVCSVGQEQDSRIWLHVSLSHPYTIPAYSVLSEVKSLLSGRIEKR